MLHRPATPLFFGLLVTIAAMAGGCASSSLDVVVGSNEDLALYQLEVGTGTLRERARVHLGARTAYLAASADGRHIYAGNGAAPGHVVAFALDRQTATFTRLNSMSSAGTVEAQGNSHVRMHPSGRWLLTAHLGSGRLSVMPVTSDGRIGPPTDTRILTKGVHQVVTDRAGRFALIPVRDAQMVAQFAVDAAVGRLVANDPPSVASAPASGPRHLALTPDERFAYVNNETNGTVSAYRYDAARGLLTPLATVSSVPAGYQETGSAHILVHPSGKFLYVSNRFHGSLASFAIDAASGALALVEIETAGGHIKFPRDFDITPDGRHLVVGNERGDSLLVLALDAASGMMTPVGTPAPAPHGPQVVVVLP